MSSLFRYIEACGSLSPSEAMLSGADFLLLSQLAYADFPESAATFGDALEGALLLPPSPRRFGFEHKNDRRLIAETAKSRRFSALAFLGFREKFDAEGACQFAALALQWDEETAIVAFRGTDQSFAGWKENFMLAYRSPVPAQALAVSFVAEIAERFHGSLILCGHSKGGNLAVYAAAFSEAPVRRRVREVIEAETSPMPVQVGRRLETEAAAALAGVKRILVVEQNHGAQLYRYLRSVYELPDARSLHRPGPLPLRPGELADAILAWSDAAHRPENRQEEIA